MVQREVVGLILAAAVVVVSAASSVGAGSSDPDLQHLLSKDQAVRQQASASILARRNEVIAGLVGIVRDKENLADRPGCVAAAVKLLGELRASEGVDAIIGVMEYQAQSNLNVARLPGFWWEKPLEGTPAYALIQIGQPCVPVLVEALARTDSVRGGCLCVLVHLRSWGEVAEILHKAVLNEPDQKRMHRLQYALSALGEMPPEGKLPRFIQEAFKKQGEKGAGH